MSAKYSLMDTLTAALISARILALVSTGTSPREAFDLVLGPGAYDQLKATFEKGE